MITDLIYYLIGFIIVLVLVIFFLLVWFSEKRIKKNFEIIYNNLALKRKGTLIKKINTTFLEFTYENSPIELATHPGDRDLPSFIRVSATVQNPQNHQLKISPKMFGSNIGKDHGMKNISIGNVDFDTKFIVKCNNELFPASLLNSQIQNNLFSLRKKYPTTTLYSNQLIINIPDYNMTSEEYDLLIDTALLFIDRLKAI